MARVLVLGCGRVGSFMARALAAVHRVTVADRDEAARTRLAGAAVSFRTADLGVPETVRTLAREADLVLGALPGALGFRALEAVLEAGRPVVDVSFFPEDPAPLAGRARSAGVTAAVDFGVAPGLAGLLVGRELGRRGGLQRARILVGGLPRVRRWPFEYATVFSPADVLEEYTRPARVKRGGELHILPALAEVEQVEVPGIGTLEAFLTDGLRTLLELPVPNLEEKTLRYPGHAEKMALLRAAGFLRLEPVTLPDGTRVSPRAVTLRLLEKAWRLEEGEEEFTYLQVELFGGGKRTLYRLMVRPDRARGVTSMVRATALPALALAAAVLRGETGAGLLTPEAAGAGPLGERLLEELAAQGLRPSRTEEAP